MICIARWQAQAAAHKLHRSAYSDRRRRRRRCRDHRR